ncbi:10116_t:CDS:2 [Diversispora eburnea]|uniref:10116_t:CDS:1 n=1 Tax=Diversispora eburnea TaxID=1213867 RepID=A0A9N8YU96_9GLOM|nr:10116_t:CDS:2 [Diversispora eburnea]
MQTQQTFCPAGHSGYFIYNYDGYDYFNCKIGICRTNCIKIYWDFIKREWKYNSSSVVALKELKDYKYDISEFIKAIKEIEISDYEYVTKFFGISKNPSTQNYIIVMESYDDTIHSSLSDIFLKIGWLPKKRLLYQIIEGLNILHENNLVHGDLNSKNALMKNHADDNKKRMNKSHEQKLIRSLYNIHPQSYYISRHIYTLYELQDSLEDIKSGKCADPNLCTYDMDSEESKWKQK